MTASNHNVRFWDAETVRRRRGVSAGDLAEFATITEAAAVVNLRDRLEKSHFDRVVALHPSHRVLDLGGGAGRFALWLAPRSAQVTAVDASNELLEVGRAEAQRRGIDNVEFVHASALNYETEDRFDLICVMGLATHLDEKDVETLISRCTSLLKPGGRLVLKEPVSTDGRVRKDERFDGNGVKLYTAWFRPGDFYREIAQRSMRLTYRAPTCAHLIPRSFGGTNDAADATTGPIASALLTHVTPIWVAIDPLLAATERWLRSRSQARRLLAEVPVLQELFVFAKPREEFGAKPGQPDLSVVVIAYNEQECLATTIEELLGTIRALGLECEIVLVDDGSEDATPQIMETLAAKHGELRIQRLPENRGIGAALRTGFDTARGRYITWLPADGQISPVVVGELYDRRLLGPIITTVYRAREDHWVRNFISTSLNTLIWLRTGSPAKSGGTYLFSRETWVQYGPREDDSMMLSTALRQSVRDAGQAVVELTIDARPRIAGHSKVLNPRAIGRTLRGLSKMGRS